MVAVDFTSTSTNNSKGKTRTFQQTKKHFHYKGKAEQGKRSFKRTSCNENCIYFHMKKKQVGNVYNKKDVRNN